MDIYNIVNSDKVLKRGSWLNSSVIRSYLGERCCVDDDLEV